MGSIYVICSRQCPNGDGIYTLLNALYKYSTSITNQPTNQKSGCLFLWNPVDFTRSLGGVTKVPFVNFSVRLGHLYMVCRCCTTNTSWPLYLRLAPLIGYHNMALKAKLCQRLDDNIPPAFATNSLLKEICSCSYEIKSVNRTVRSSSKGIICRYIMISKRLFRD